MAFCQRCLGFFFFIAFWKEYIKKEQSGLSKAVALAIFGSSLMLLLRVYGLFRVFEINITSSFKIEQMMLIIIPLISSLFFLIFLLAFYKEQKDQKQKRLKIASLLAAIGSAVFLLSHIFNLINTYLLNLKVDLTYWRLAPGNIALLAILLPLGVFIFLTQVYFMITFYQSLS